MKKDLQVAVIAQLEGICKLNGLDLEKNQDSLTIYFNRNNTASHKEIIDYLNLKSKKNFKANTAATKRLINARLKEGYTKLDFFGVIDVKCSQWMDTDMESYIRPQTLFGTKFESYLQEKPKETTDNKLLSILDGEW